MRTLIVGSGFVGGALARSLATDGDSALVASRRPPGLEHDADPLAPQWIQLDATEADDCARVVESSGADTIVLVHGPSDVTWCAQHPEEAVLGHLKAARNTARAADVLRTILISTDNVFDGSVPLPDERTPANPANAYGRAKLAAEEVFADRPEACALRVSLIYDWESGENGKWLNFFASCALRLRAGE